MIEFVITGPDAERRAKEAAGALAETLGYVPESRREVALARDRGVYEAVSIVLMIPPALVATLNLVQRVKMLGGLRELVGKLPEGITARGAGPAVAVGAGSARAVLDLAEGAAIEAVYDVYVSTAPADAEVGEALAAALRGAGLRTFWRGDLLPGDAWPTALWNAQRTARATVALVSPEWPTQWYQSEALVRGIELKRAWDHGVIPVYRDGAPASLDDIPPGLGVLTSVDLRAAGPVKAAARIAEALARGAG